MKKMIISLATLMIVKHAYALELKEVYTTNKQGEAIEVNALANGQTIYVFDPDQTNGNSVCNAACAEKWPPVLLTADETIGLTENQGSIQRQSGLTQLTISSKPVYTFFQDRSEGDINGDGLGGVWHVLEIND